MSVNKDFSWLSALTTEELEQIVEIMGEPQREALRSALSQRHSPDFERGKLQARAIAAVTDLKSWCDENEANWSGWGEQTIPDGATRWTKQAESALALIKDMADPTNLSPLELAVVEAKVRQSISQLSKHEAQEIIKAGTIQINPSKTGA